MKIFLTGASGFIGTHLLNELVTLYPKAVIRNVDLKRPKVEAHARFWRKRDIMDKTLMLSELREFAPTHVIHMAARTDPHGASVKEYNANTEGSENLLAAMKEVPSIKRSVFFSTQYVVRPGPLATHDRDYRPYNTYGKSKSLMEEAIRSDPGLPGIWTIVRPTNVWGPWHPRYAEEFWLVVKKGHYVHPGGKPVVRAYGYVGNVVEYVIRILQSDSDRVKSKTYYVGDPVDDIYEWVAGFSRALIGREPRVVPRPILRSIAMFGDIVRATGRSFPLFTARYKSMTQDYIVDMEPTFVALGLPRFTLSEGVASTLEWLETQEGIWKRAPI